MKKKLFNVITYTFLLYSIFTATFVAMPQIQDALPFLTIPTVLVSGGFTGLLGSAGLVVDSFLKKARVEADDKFVGLVAHLNDVTNVVNKIVEENKVLREQITLDNKNLKESVNRNNELQEAHLKEKLSNVLIDDEVKRILNEVLNNEKE